MPSVGSNIEFKYGSSSRYNEIAVKDPNTVYFLEDTRQIFIGDKEYTRPISRSTSQTGDSPSFSTVPGSLHIVRVPSSGTPGTDQYVPSRDDMYVNLLGNSNSWVKILTNSSLEGLVKYNVDQNISLSDKFRVNKNIGSYPYIEVTDEMLSGGTVEQFLYNHRNNRAFYHYATTTYMLNSDLSILKFSDDSDNYLEVISLEGQGSSSKTLLSINDTGILINGLSIGMTDTSSTVLLPGDLVLSHPDSYSQYDREVLLSVIRNNPGQSNERCILRLVDDNAHIQDPTDLVVRGVADPVEGNDAVNKTYADSHYVPLNQGSGTNLIRTNEIILDSEDHSYIHISLISSTENNVGSFLKLSDVESPGVPVVILNVGDPPEGYPYAAANKRYVDNNFAKKSSEDIVRFGGVIFSKRESDQSTSKVLVSSGYYDQGDQALIFEEVDNPGVPVYLSNVRSPKEDNQVANKKYVDDAIRNAVGDMLGGVY